MSMLGFQLVHIKQFTTQLNLNTKPIHPNGINFERVQKQIPLTERGNFLNKS